MAWERTKPPCGLQLNRMHPLARGLVGCWMLNEGAGRLCNNLAGNENGTLGVGASWKGNLVTSGSANGQMVTQTNLGITPTSFTLVIKATPLILYNSAAGVGCAGSLGADSGGSPAICYSGSTTKIGVLLGGITWINSTVAMVVGNSYHLALTCNGTAQAFYINGVLAATGSSTLTTIGVFTLGNQLSSGRYANQSVDNALLYNRSLTAQEVTNLYAQPYQMMMAPVQNRMFFVSGGTLYTQNITATATATAFKAVAISSVKSATATQTSNKQASVQARRSAVTTQSAAAVKNVSAIRTVTQAVSGLVVKAIGKVRSVTVTCTASVTALKAKFLVITATAVQTASTARNVFAIRSGTQVQTGAVRKAVSKAWSATQTCSATCTKSIGRVLSATATVSGLLTTIKNAAGVGGAVLRRITLLLIKRR